MRYFFYGTLMDADVLSAVTGRRFRRHHLVPAWLHDWRCVAVPKAPYPAVVPVRGRTCDGVVIDGVDRRMARRLATYEGPLYREGEVEIETVRGERLAAAVFLPRPSLAVAPLDWSFDAWRKRHKRRYMRRLNAPGWQAG